MFRPTSRLIARSTAARVLPRASPATPARRFISTAPPTQKSRSWKSLAARWGAAGAIVYYYSTSNLFAEEPVHAAAPHVYDADVETEQLPTIEALAAERRARKENRVTIEEKAVGHASGTEAQDVAVGGGKGGVEGLEEEADQQGAFNPETGEINWDCPCLGGMADGPCGEQFKAAFSCFVFSTEEPKGMDCIDKFKDMQNCFREHPDVYGSELQEDEEDDVSAADLEGPGLAKAENTSSESTTASESSASTQPPSNHQAEKVGQPTNSEEDQQAMTKRAKAATEQVKADHEPLSESERVVPRAQFDAREK